MVQWSWASSSGRYRSVLVAKTLWVEWEQIFSIMDCESCVFPPHCLFWMMTAFTWVQVESSELLIFISARVINIPKWMLECWWFPRGKNHSDNLSLFNFTCKIHDYEIFEVFAIKCQHFSVIVGTSAHLVNTRIGWSGSENAMAVTQWHIQGYFIVCFISSQYTLILDNSVRFSNGVVFPMIVTTLDHSILFQYYRLPDTYKLRIMINWYSMCPWR